MTPCKKLWWKQAKRTICENKRAKLKLEARQIRERIAWQYKNDLIGPEEYYSKLREAGSKESLALDYYLRYRQSDFY